MIERIKEALGCKTNQELSVKLGINKSQITRWKKTGFHPSTEKLINLLLEKIKGVNNEKK